MIRQIPNPVTIGRSTARGGRRITSISCGSKEMTKPSATDVTIFTQSTCGAVIGVVNPTKIATAMTSACATLVGNMKSMAFSILLKTVRPSFTAAEIEVMRRPPRAVDRPIVTGFGIWRIMFVGLALLAYTLLAFFWMRSLGASDALARTVSVNALTVGQVFYLLNSRYLLDSSLNFKAHMGNKYLPLGIISVVILQLLFTYAPPFQAMFGYESIPLWVWPWIIAGGFVFFLVVEIEKLVIRSSGFLRKLIVAAEAGVVRQP